MGALKPTHRSPRGALGKSIARSPGFHSPVAAPYVAGGDAPLGGELVARFLDERGLIAIGDVADWFGMSKGQLAATVGVKPEALRRLKRIASPKSQARVKEMLEIIGRVAEWAGGKDQAMAWYRAEPLPAFGGRTAEFLVKEGRAETVRDYLDHVATGGVV